MALSLYNIGNWAANTTYNLHDIYKYGGLYYYSLQKHNSGTSFNTALSDGVISYNGVLKPHFFWKPSYNSDLEIIPTVKKAQFGDGYGQRTPDGINNTLLPFNLIFDKRSDAEARAILHFLENKRGSQSFVFVPPFPFNIQKLFICERFRHSQLFASNHSINAVFQEVPV